MRYTIIFYIKLFLPYGVSPRSLTDQFPSPPFTLFFYLRDESLICDSINFENVATKTSLRLSSVLITLEKFVFTLEILL